MSNELDPEEVFRDDEDDPDNDPFQQREATRDLVVYLIDASPKMFSSSCATEDDGDETHFHVAFSCISQALKAQIINKSDDEVAICFFNTREKKNLQDLSGVFVFNVPGREFLDFPTARLIMEFDRVEETFMKEIGSKYGIIPGSRENSLYNALWVAQALLRKRSVKSVDKRIVLFTNEDDPFGTMKGAVKLDMMRTTVQRAKDAQDLGITIDLLPLSRPGERFNVSTFFADMIGMEDTECTDFMSSAGARLEDMKYQLRKHMFKKRIVRRLTFTIAEGFSIELNTYALIRPTFPGKITWLDSITNLPVKSERSFICADTGALMREPVKRVQPYKNQNIMFTTDELSEMKRVAPGQFRLLGFKPLECLKDYHNLKPSTFVFPSDEEVIGGTLVFISLHRSMIKFKRFAIAFHGSMSRPQLVALVAQEEIITDGGQVEPLGMHMIYLPYSDDIRPVEELHSNVDEAPRATDDQLAKADAVIRRMDLQDFSVCQFSNPALQRHYAILQAIALDEDEMPEVNDETVPDEEGMARPGVVKVLEEFKISVYGENSEGDDESANAGKASEASKKRKAAAENAAANYDWSDLAVNGKLKDLTVVELKHYLALHDLPVAGKKELLISRILTHLRK